jgi:myo-inositol-1(or 4)-monophosphatase
MEEDADLSGAELLRAMMRAARAAGDAILAERGGEVTFKSADQPLTAADLAADRVLREHLTVALPGSGWLSEEAPDDPQRLRSERVWIVDPLDGTWAFVDGLDEYAVCIALCREGLPELAVVYNPARDVLLHAVRGGGAFRDGARIGVAAPGRPEWPVVVVSSTELETGRVPPLPADWRIRTVGSTAWKLAEVATGEADAYLSHAPKAEWDLCAPALLVEEAGGRVTDARGRPLRYNRPDPSVEGVLAARPGLMHRLPRIDGRHDEPRRIR